MTYKYLDIDINNLPQKPSDIWLDGFQSFIDSQFYNAPDAFIIQEELNIGQLNFQNVEVRINRGINTYTGEKLGDDFKQLIFRDLAHATSVGYKYYFDDNYWIVVNSEIIKNFAASCIVRRCNNVLRWVDEYGNYYEEPCSIDYKLNESRDIISTKDPVTPKGYIEVYCQSNERTRKIFGNQRFLFGSKNNRIGFKVFGDGIRNFLNQKTYDDDSSAILVLTMGGNYVNRETDDIVNGIADVNNLIYNLSMSPNYVSGSVSNSFQLNPYVTYNGISVSVPLTYFSSASSIATVSSSGLVSMISNGSAVISAYMTKNTSASAICNVVVSASPIGYNEIRISPEPTFIFEGSSQNYNFYLYENGNYIPSSFVFNVSGSLVPESHYSLISSASSLLITNNLRYLNYPLTIDCASGSVIRQVEINLKGAW